MPTPRVSVVLPVLNPHPEHFRAAVASILNQTLRDLELIVIEDPSPRHAGDTLQLFDDPRIQYVRNPERTAFALQLNQGLAMARGEIVARMDADDVCEPERLAKQLALYEEIGNATVVGSQLRVIDDDGKELGYRAYPTTHDAILKALPRYCAMAHPSVVFHKERVIALGGYQPSPYPGVEDYELWSRLAARGYRFANHPEALVNYRVHPEGMKTARLRTLLRGTLHVKDQYWRERMDLRMRARYWGECMLLYSPAWLTLRLFLATQYRSTL